MTDRPIHKLLLDWQVIDGNGGPGTTNDRRGSWHVLCHLASAAGLFWLPGRCASWVGILYDGDKRRYFAAVCADANGKRSILSLKSRKAGELIASGEWRGFLEGASRGHILDRAANDPGDPEKDDRRQDYDQNVNSPKEGGPVWEMWTVSRDIRPRNPLGNSLVNAYSELLDVLGGRFAAVVARGRMEPEYGHLRQMCAMIDAGFITPEEALTDIDTIAIPPDVERILLEATPEAFAQAATLLVRRQRKPSYFMYSRRLSSFAPASLLRKLITTLGPAVIVPPN